MCVCLDVWNVTRYGGNVYENECVRWSLGRSYGVYAVVEAGERVCGVEKTVWMRDRVSEE